ncbi:MAG: hypothetical protein EOO01_14875 [Chitinophagaceae bacterium]|nr:MAG: hypothetical protein EOO01_14875 [Chitinophagaceae bacterium]
MSVRKQIHQTQGQFFITFTCHLWLDLFEITDCYNFIYEQFDMLKAEGHYVVGYVIMPNHIHVIIDFSPTVKDINRRIGTMKRFIGYEIVRRLQCKNDHRTLQMLANGVAVEERKKGKLYQVFRPSFDIKYCYEPWFTEQKLGYIHNNPCKGRNPLSSKPERYLHSSASFYFTGKTGLYEVTHFMDRRNN